MMRQITCAIAAVTTLAGTALAVRADDVDAGAELAFVQSTVTATLLNEGGKYVTIDLKHIPQGGTCRVDKDSVVMRVGPGSGAGLTRVRFAAPQMSSGGCPFLTEFDLPDADYAAARAAFVAKKDEASKKVDDLKKQLGDKWDEMTGAKK